MHFRVITLVCNFGKKKLNKLEFLPTIHTKTNQDGCVATKGLKWSNFHG